MKPDREAFLFQNGYGLSVLNLDKLFYEMALLKREPGPLNNVTRRYETWRVAYLDGFMDDIVRGSVFSRDQILTRIKALPAHD